MALLGWDKHTIMKTVQNDKLIATVTCSVDKKQDKVGNSLVSYITVLDIFSTFGSYLLELPSATRNLFYFSSLGSC